MNLLEMKKRIYELIEEASDSETVLTDDPDYEKKINTCINIINNELARIRKIPAKMEFDASEENTMKFPSDMYQINKVIGTDFEVIGDEIIFPEDFKDIATIYYYKFPNEINRDTEDEEYEFELEQDALECLAFGVAGDMLKSDPSTNYGTIYSNRYNELKQYLDTRRTTGTIFIDNSEAI